jgi:methionyl-tRNA formyltransferase
MARTLRLPLQQPQSVNDPEVRERIAAVAPDVVIVCAFGALIKEPLLSDYEILNVHPSLLPRWRGAAPIERAIMAGDAQTGVSIMRLTAGLDSGPVALTAAEPILPADTYGSLAPRLERLGAELLLRALHEPFTFVQQSEAGVTYAEKISATDRLLDPCSSAATLERQVRALQPHIGARLALADGSLLGVQQAAVAGTETIDVAQEPAAGTLAAVAGRLLYGTADGSLELLQVQPSGGRPMDAAAYMRGHAR